MTAPRPASSDHPPALPPEAVEAVMRQVHAHPLLCQITVHDASPGMLHLWREDARRILTAALPALRRMVLAEAVEDAGDASVPLSDAYAWAAPEVMDKHWVSMDRLRALLPSPVAGDAPGADTTEGGKDG